MKWSANLLIVGCALVAVAADRAQAAPIVQNGDFEDVQIGTPFNSTNPANIPGWTHTGSVGDALLWAVGYADGGGNITVAGHGNQFVTLGSGFNQPPGSAQWSTMITGLTVGSTYDLSFFIANEGADANQPETLTVSFASGSSAVPQAFTAPTAFANYWKTWLPEAETFVATATSATVVFSVTNQSFDMGLDCVAVTPGTTPGTCAAVVPAPEPASLALLGAGLAGLGIARRRRKSL